MADLQISGLPTAGSLALTNQLPTDDVTNTTYKFTLTQLLAFLLTFINTPASSVTVTTATQAMIPVTSYLIDYVSGLCTLTLPSAITEGQQMQVIGYSAGGWKIAQGAGQQVLWGSKMTTSGVVGNLASTDATDCLTLVCVVDNLTFIVIQPQGNITIV